MHNQIAVSFINVPLAIQNTARFVPLMNRLYPPIPLLEHIKRLTKHSFEPGIKIVAEEKALIPSIVKSIDKSIDKVVMPSFTEKSKERMKNGRKSPDLYT